MWFIFQNYRSFLRCSLDNFWPFLWYFCTFLRPFITFLATFSTFEKFFTFFNFSKLPKIAPKMSQIKHCACLVKICEVFACFLAFKLFAWQNVACGYIRWMISVDTAKKYNKQAWQAAMRSLVLYNNSLLAYLGRFGCAICVQLPLLQQKRGLRSWIAPFYPSWHLWQMWRIQVCQRKRLAMLSRGRGQIQVLFGLWKCCVIVSITSNQPYWTHQSSFF